MSFKTGDKVKCNCPAHQRLISKLEKFAQECYDQGFASGWDGAKGVYEERIGNEQ